MAQVTATFAAPDTVCKGVPFNITNQSTGGSSYEWRVCLSNPSQSITGQNIGGPSGLHNRPTGIQIFKEGNNWVGFVGNDAGTSVSRSLQRLDFGTSILNTPTITNLPTFGVLYNPLIVRFYWENNRWYALSFAGWNGTNGRATHVVLLDFGNSLFNTPVLLRDFTNLGGLVPANTLYNGIAIAKSGSNIVAFISSVPGPIYRIDFGNTITNPTPSFFNLGTFSFLTRSGVSKLVENNGSWHLFVVNDGYPNNPANDRLVRLDFGNSLLNSPTAVNLGNPNGVMNRVSDIQPYYECETFKMYGVNEANFNIINLTFPNGPSSNTVSGVALGNVGNLSNPGGMSQLLTDGLDKYLFVVNTSNNTISRIKVTNCNDAGIPVYTTFNPPPITLNQLGTYNISLYVNQGLPTEKSACQQVVVIDPIPQPLAAYEPICVGDTLELSVNNIQTGVNYSWTGPNGFTSQLPNPIILNTTQANAGRYIVTATGTCNNQKDTLDIIFNTTPTFNLGNDTTYCSSFSRTLSTGNVQTTWSNGQTGASITVTQTGLYWAQLTNGCGTFRDTIRLLAGSLPTVNLGNDTSYCGSFSRILNSGSAQTTWSTGQTGSSITVTQPGTYWAQVTNNCGSRRDTIVISVSGLPSFNLGNDTTYCSTFSRTLTTGNAQTTWSTGQTSASITVSQPGLYWAQLTNACGTFRDTIRLIAGSLPIVNLGNDTAYCGTFSRVLNSGSAQTTWSTGQSGTTITITQPGLYWAQVTNTCGSRRDTIVITQLSLPSFNLGNDTSYCTAFSRTLSTGNAQTTWSTGQTGASITVTQPGLYWAQLTNTCGSFRDSIRITLGAPPAISLGNDTTYCGTFSRNLSTGNAQTTWSTGQTAASITVTQPGLYWAQITNTCGTRRDTIVISQSFLPSFTLGNDTSYCTSFSRTLSTGNSQTTWSTGQTGSSITVTQPGLYWAQLTNSCGAFRDTIRLSITSLPSVNLGSDTTYCGTFSRNLSTGTAQTTWSTGQSGASISVNQPGLYWAQVSNACGSTRDSIVIDQLFPPSFYLGNDSSFCGTFNSTLSTGDPQTTWSTGQTGGSITVTQPGLYWAQLVNGCGPFRDSILITVDTLAVFELGNDTLVCDPNFLLQTGYAQTVWSTGDIGSSITVDETGFYSAAVSNACGTSGDTIRVEFRSLPDIDLGEDQLICIEDSITLSVPQGSIVTWSTGATGYSIVVNEAGLYWAIIENECGEVSDSVQITTRSCLVCHVAVPSAFTPNGDGQNDIFRPIFTCPTDQYKFLVGNRWGEIVYSSSSAGKWDGLYKGDPAPVDAYIWYLEYIDQNDGTVKSMKGPVTLIR